METKIPTIEVTATKVFVIENAAEGASASPGFEAGPLVPGVGGEEVFGVGDEGEGAGEAVVDGEGVGDVFVEGDGAGAELGDNDRVGAGAGACCAMHDVAKSPNIKNTLIATEPMLLIYMFF
ncbi:uncharacterized protein LOC131645945 [Vicia villosa]|uniref:uncharacterized protein LOC131645945 n=1 Tax=Vicia villosa TaxID=3911 RepID=UPI00273C8FC8|nr:uncharacterized protein LOC131645945 [Vicia villosa]